MHLDTFDYQLPPELIAQEPLSRRDAARLLVLRRSHGTVTETVFSGIVSLLRPGDLLVLNDTRVIPARLIGSKESGGRTEIFLVRRLAGPGEVWQCLLRASKSPRPGQMIRLPHGVTAQVVERQDETWRVAFSPEEGFEEWLDRAGQMPLPPYIRRSSADLDQERYQTVFGRNRGAVAAPTAGLHMTPELLNELVARGIAIASVTLHVGLGTFLPVRVDDIREHRMHRELCSIPIATADAVAETRRKGGRVVALGTTVCRALEHASDEAGVLVPGETEADIFIYPGYRFRIVDALITNFHLPKSTLLMLVSAFAGKDFLLEAYAQAVERQFRFFSYGDAMFIE
ncbi:tRNA preQ1(34) S-adenosylmethionine ribosyltransferase-isomerase QueA [Geobacter sp. DSM 9736]|uniref:tRNA preQ1(34) S-adenosylmethionine ribosyltransferase-isomerase QueA n=1 Tax=Geobacter sp. DSM 9736 TaxID=1277350 RepID=UPI000B512069|nr:tRNA preQ1(34) S-adenosylmethionine ribosyltransferase-isomerase QueA [Geobacter sp. DSM 9736]SNB44834.1 S-adenosylmethionine--tRNA ribosyltransferase-isomerase [Geobacter sp. DSM 9736]